MIRRSGIGTITNLFAAAAACAALLFLAAKGAGPVPPLGPAFNPGTGVWSVAADAKLPSARTLHLAGLQHSARVLFETVGTAHIRAASDYDLWLVNGYLNARFRLFEMDLLRRRGEGLISQVIGSAALTSDRFELRLGLKRTAETEWRAMAPNDPARQVLAAYARGVNDGIREDEANHNLPVLFKLLGYEPALWTPVDTLVVQGDETQNLDFTTTPLDYALLARHLGYARTMQWFPILPSDVQHPYDPGPYRKAPLAPLLSQQSVSASTAALAAVLQKEIAALPPGAIHDASNSNNWAVDGTKTASGKPLLAGDPHLHQTLPAIWYQLAGDAPGLHFSGVGIPGTPGIIIGHNQHISWSETNTQNQATLFYLERTNPANPHQYFWNGSWRPMRRLIYTIPVKGGSSDRFEVDLTIHGPLISSGRVPGKALSIDWMGALPSPDLDVLLGIMRAANFSQFRDALRGWHAPSQNFVYADDAGNIGLISAGYYPIVRRGAPWLPLPGTGEADVAGTIPFDTVPQVYDPKSHFVLSANQRPVASRYPYYIGTTLDFFDNGYRANRIYDVLSRAHSLTVRDIERLQNDVHDYLAGEIVPKLLTSLRSENLGVRQAQARTLLREWDDGMRENSPSAAIWWTFWQQYIRDTFQPWWDANHVPGNRFHSVRVSVDRTSLDEDLEAWTLRDPSNSAFSLPDGTRRDAGDVIRKAFGETVATLTRTLGTDPRAWRWGRLHRRKFESLAQITSLQYGPRAAGGDNWTVNAADKGYTATAGPSWRFIMDWGSRQGEGVYPGGQSENPLSPWYQNQIDTWWAGRYYPMLSYVQAAARRGAVVWKAQP